MARRIAVSNSDVPFLPEKRIEAEADLLLAEYGERFASIASPPVPVDDIAELLLELTLEYKDMKALFPFADVHGAIWFEQRKIAIEQRLDPHVNPSRRARYHFTLAHEVGHWRLHREHYRKNPAERRLFDDGTTMPDVVCRSSERKKPVEWQADKFASCLLMPRKLVYAAWSEFRGGDDGPVVIGELHSQFAGAAILRRGRLATTGEEKDQAVMEEFCLPLAKRFEVSAEAMRIRLEGLHLFVQEKPKMLF